MPASAESLAPWLAGLVDAATTRYLWYGHGEGVMLVHSATAPNAILRTLPALDQRLWAPSVDASWAAAAAVTASYAPAVPAGPAELPDPPGGPQAAEETFARAVEHGDEHVIKLADTAADARALTLLAREQERIPAARVTFHLAARDAAPAPDGSPPASDSRG